MEKLKGQKDKTNSEKEIRSKNKYGENNRARHKSIQPRKGGQNSIALHILDRVDNSRSHHRHPLKSI